MSLQDGGVVYNLPATITIDGETYVPESIDINRGGSRAETRDIGNVPNSQYLSDDQPDGTIVLQMTDPTKLPPQNTQSAVFALDVQGGSPENFIITSVGQAYAAGEAYKVTCSLVKAIVVVPTP